MNRTITNIYNLNSDYSKSVTCGEGYMLIVLKQYQVNNESI